VNKKETIRFKRALVGKGGMQEPLLIDRIVIDTKGRTTIPLKMRELIPVKDEYEIRLVKQGESSPTRWFILIQEVIA